jgi:hypothetical protein
MFNLLRGIKMKILILFLAIVLIASNVQAQKLNKTDVLQDDVYLYPPHYEDIPEPDLLKRDFNRLRLRLTDIRSILRGDFNGDGFEELALVGDFNSNWNDPDDVLDFSLQISTLESRAYKIIDPTKDYNDPVEVNTQEGYSGMRMMDHPSNSTRVGSNTFSFQQTRNAILDRHSSSITLNSNTFAVSGNFHPGSSTITRDEILVFRNTGSNVENVTMFEHNNSSTLPAKA